MPDTPHDVESIPPSSEELHENSLAVKAALRDIEAGEKGRPFKEFAEEFRQRNNITDDE